MNFDDSPEEAAFRAEVKTWLAKEAPKFDATGIDDVATRVKLGRAWQRAKAEAGFAGIRWPKAIGGRGGSPIEAAIFDEEEAKYCLPLGVYLNIGMNMAVPAITRHGTPGQAERFTRPTLLGEIIWCQLFSEPAAGSDLAALKTRAVKDGENWIVNGQKVWSSWAHHADFGILLARTDAEVAKHKGITFFVIDMKTPGIDIRPIRQISGESEFNEVFLDNVVISDDNRIGSEGEGWACAMTTLMSERLSASKSTAKHICPDDLIEAIRQQNRSPTGHEVARIAHWKALEMGTANFRLRLLTDLAKGNSIGPRAAILKLTHGKMLQDMGAFAMDIQGPHALAAGSGNEFQVKADFSFFWGAVLRIAGGADEVLRNQLAERVLNMPRDYRPDLAHSAGK